MTERHYTEDEARALVERAYDEVEAICKEGPHKRWRWSIPARPENDSDLIIIDGLKAATGLIVQLLAERNDLRTLLKLTDAARAYQLDSAAAHLSHGDEKTGSIDDPDVRERAARVARRMFEDGAS